MTNEILKEEYFSTLEYYKQLDSNQQNQYIVRLNEVKELKNKAINNTVSSISKKYLLKQSHTKLKTVKQEILEQIKDNNIEKYKAEVEKLQTIFKQKEFTQKEKQHLVKKTASINGFDYKQFMIYIKENSKLFSSTVMSDIESLFSLS